MSEYIGIDPGKRGGVARLDGQGIVLELEKMPDSEADLLRLLRPSGNDLFVLLEKVSASPGAGVTSMFTFGHNYGLCQGCLAGAEVPWELVRPVEWQRGLGILKGARGEGYTARKQRLKAHAKRLFPGEVKRIINATADALLIAEYCRRKMRGMLG